MCKETTDPSPEPQVMYAALADTLLLAQWHLCQKCNLQQKVVSLLSEPLHLWQFVTFQQQKTNTDAYMRLRQGGFQLVCFLKQLI